MQAPHGHILHCSLDSKVHIDCKDFPCRSHGHIMLMQCKSHRLAAEEVVVIASLDPAGHSMILPLAVSLPNFFSLLFSTPFLFLPFLPSWVEVPGQLKIVLARWYNAQWILLQTMPLCQVTVTFLTAVPGLIQLQEMHGCWHIGTSIFNCF